MKETVDLVVWYQDLTERATFYITTLGGTELILGHPWLVCHNPEIDWEAGKVVMSHCPEECCIHHIQASRKHRQRYKLRKKTQALLKILPLPATVEELLEDDEIPLEDTQGDDDTLEVGDHIFSAIISSEPVFISATSTVSTRLAEAADKHRVQKDWKDIVPEAYHHFESVFLKESFDELPQRCKWDHAIELVPGAEPFSTKIYPMSPV